MGISELSPEIVYWFVFANILLGIYATWFLGGFLFPIILVSIVGRKATWTAETRRNRSLLMIVIGGSITLGFVVLDVGLAIAMDTPPDYLSIALVLVFNGSAACIGYRMIDRVIRNADLKAGLVKLPKYVGDTNFVPTAHVSAPGETTEAIELAPFIGTWTPSTWNTQGYMQWCSYDGQDGVRMSYSLTISGLRTYLCRTDSQPIQEPTTGFADRLIEAICYSGRFPIAGSAGTILRKYTCFKCGSLMDDPNDSRKIKGSVELEDVPPFEVTYEGPVMWCPSCQTMQMLPRDDRSGYDNPYRPVVDKCLKNGGIGVRAAIDRLPTKYQTWREKTPSEEI